MTDAALDALARSHGIEGEYYDIWGNRHAVGDPTKRALLAAMGIPAADTVACERALEEARVRRWRRVLEPALVARDSGPAIAVDVRLPAGVKAVRWSLTLEDGRGYGGDIDADRLAVEEETRIEGVKFRRCRFDLPARPGPGYHTLRIVAGSAEGANPDPMRLIVVPDACYRPEAIAGERRAWGFQVQLYALRSRRNWGMGDLTDLKALIDVCADAGAGVVAVNPLHALFPCNPAHASPYSPSSRLFGNVLYLDVEAIPEFGECRAATDAVGAPRFRERLEALRAAEMVDYPAVAETKLSVLELLHRDFRERHLERNSPRAEVFRAFRARGGEALRRHCIFDALHESLRRSAPSFGSWRAWPPAYRSADAPEVQAFAAENAERVEFFEYLQWQFDEQLSSAAARARERGLGVGLEFDLAVSVDGGGSESWANRDCYAGLASVGAPPDPLNLLGQDWGLPPCVPERLREAGYASFSATLRANMRGGALRIDHVMWLMRLFWIPSGAKCADGAYVRYPFEDMLGILALESVRNRCLVVGEDLGTVPDEVRRALARLRVLSFRPMLFQREPDGAFSAPRDYPQDAAAAVSTHDLPTLEGFWRGTDLEVRGRLGLFPDEARREAELAARARDRERLLAALEREGLLPEGARGGPSPEFSSELALNVHRFAARAPARLLLVQLEDVLGQLHQVNLPGTADEYPNWRRKLPLELERIPADPRMEALAEALRRERGAAVSPQPWRFPRAEAGPRIPLATYRLQFNQNFTFSAATDLVAYLSALGISHCYASPYLKARPGSAHGYDIIDHNALNPEVGSRAEFDRFVETLRVHGMGQMLDVVPNHMGVLGADNAWWLDVLENGRASEFADFFDIDWTPLDPQLRDKVLVPVLGDHYGSVLEKGELKLVHDAGRGEFSVVFREHRFPVDPREYPRILARRLDRLEASLGARHATPRALRELGAAFEGLPRRSEISAERSAQRRRDKEALKARLADLCARSPEAGRFIGENLAEVNGTPGDPRSFDALDELIQAQAYRLAYWRVAADEINYRRFFDINDLAALRMEREEVFEATHRLILELVAAGKVDALRIDHPDGLYDPARYFERLQNRVAAVRARPAQAAAAAPGRHIYLVVEKVVAAHERLPEGWPVHGTTGYRFSNLVNGLFVDADAEERVTRAYAEFIGQRADFGEIVSRARRLIMRSRLASELNVLTNRLAHIASLDRHSRDFTVSGLREALIEIVACFPVYRTYIGPGAVSAEDRRFIEWAVAAARRRSRSADPTVFEFVRGVLLAGAGEDRDAQYRDAALAFTMRFQQFTSPVMAKGLEDTALYVYNRLLSLNEVGGDPRRFGMSLAAFHAASQDRAKTWPHTMLATTTHDSKRSEDVRARINVLSEMPEAWRAAVRRWSRLNRGKKKQVDGAPAPSANDEYALYQTLVGSWPIEPLDRAGLDAYRRRIEEYVTKFMREAKLHTSWINPDPEYEQAALDFVRSLLAPGKGNVFLKAFLPIQRRVSRFGMFNSLSQTVIKLASPGVPDIYQGTELWDYSLVDPDNRRPVNYLRRQAIAEEIRRRGSGPASHGSAAPGELLRSMEDGRIKLFVIQRALALRRERAALFRDGEYLPLAVEGSRADHLCAFARRRGGEIAIAAAPRLCLRLLQGGGDAPVGADAWSDTRVILPFAGAGAEYQDVFTGRRHRPEPLRERAALPASALLADFPVALAHDVSA